MRDVALPIKGQNRISAHWDIFVYFFLPLVHSRRERFARQMYLINIAENP